MRLPILSNMLNLGITNPLGASSLRITSRNGVEVILCITYKVKDSTMYVIKGDLSTIASFLNDIRLCHAHIELVDSHS